jgi:hypothetical protein
MTYDAHANLAYTTVAGAPGIAGLQLEVAAGSQTLFSTPPFNMICWPPEVQPTAATCEIVRVTAINGILFTITRAQEGTTAQNIAVGWQCAAGPTVKTFTDIETAVTAETTRAEAEEATLATAITVAQSAAETYAASQASAAQSAAEAASEQSLVATGVKTAAYTASPGQEVVVDISAGNVPVTLPNAPADQSRVGIKVVNVNATPGTFTATLVCAGSDTFNVASGPTSLTFSAKYQGSIAKYQASTKVWTVTATDDALGSPLGAAKAGADGLVGTVGQGGTQLAAGVPNAAAATSGQIPTANGSGGYTWKSQVDGGSL